MRTGTSESMGSRQVGRVLVICNMYPTTQAPAFGKFVEAQVETLRQLGCEQDLLVIRGKRNLVKYLSGLLELRRRIRSCSYSSVHAYYGLCGFVAMFQTKAPIVITFCGSDLNPGFAGRRRALVRSLLITSLGQLASLRAQVCIVRSHKMLARLR